MQRRFGLALQSTFLQLLEHYRDESDIQLAPTPDPRFSTSQKLFAELQIQTKAGLMDALRSPMPRLPFFRSPARDNPSRGRR